MAANAERLCEVGKIREAENFFQFCKTVVVRWATVGRTSCSSGAAAPRCTEGERSEPFVQRVNIRRFRRTFCIVWRNPTKQHKKYYKISLLF